MQQILEQLEGGTVWNVGDEKQIHRPPTSKELYAARVIRELAQKNIQLGVALQTAMQQAHEYQNLYENQRQASKMGNEHTPSGGHSDVPERGTPHSTEEPSRSDSGSSAEASPDGVTA